MTAIVAIALVCGLIGGCIRVKDSPAPGCVEYLGWTPMGGCLGNAVIKDVSVDSKVDCLTVGPNTCNGGILTVENRCKEKVVIEGLEIKLIHDDIEIIRGKGDEVVVEHTHGNFATYKPAEDDSISAEGSIEKTKFTISYTKTWPLC